jgi:hypothetical protein
MLRGWAGHVTTKAPMSEWSKEADLRDSTGIISNLLHQRVGSNPTRCKTPCIWVKYTIFSHSVVVITPDFESGNPDSNSGGRYLLACML